MQQWVGDNCQKIITQVNSLVSVNDIFIYVEWMLHIKTLLKPYAD